MQGKIRPSCVICAWRESCQKKYSIIDPAMCQDFSLDLSIKDAGGRKGVKLLIEGSPGSGKSTLVERIITKLGDSVKAGGFFTREVRRSGERIGFKIVTVDKMEAMLASAGSPGNVKVGKYTVHLENIDAVAVPSILSAVNEGELIIIDEIGKMELKSKRFTELVDIVMDCDCPVLATVPQDGGPFVEKLKHRADVRILHIDKNNRDSLLDEAASIIKGG